MPQEKRTGIGIASLILGVIAIITFFIPIFVFGVLATIFGAVSYWGKDKDNYGLAGFILGITAVVLNVIILVLVVAVGLHMHRRIYVYASRVLSLVH